MALDPKEVKSDLVLILDFGSQYTHLITRRIRSLSVFSLCISGTSPLSAITSLNPKVVILSGGPHSVHSADSPSFPEGFIEWVNSNGVFVLGICYGLQLLVQRLGGEVRIGEKQEYGRMEIEVQKNSGIFGGKSVGDKQVVWMSHGDEAAKLPPGFEVVARSHQGAVAAVENKEMRFFGLQYHPEVDEIFIQSIKDAGLYDSIWQAFAVFLPVKSVGVQGDQRTHSHVVALRAVTSQDGMTADWYNFEHKFLDDVSRKICNSVRGVNRVVQDITSKPPSTIEWE